MREEVIFTKLDELVNEKENISKNYENGKWKIFGYTAGKYSGNLLVAPEESYPEKVSFDLNLRGLYHIYLCLPQFRTTNFIDIKLSKDMCYSGIIASDRSPKNWTSEEFFEEVYWKTADLTDEKIIFQKGKSSWLAAPAIAWVRCVPAESMPKPACNKCIQMHIDGDLPATENVMTDDEYLMKLYPMKDSNVDFVSFEFSFHIDSYIEEDKGHLLYLDRKWTEGDYNYIPKTEMVYKKAVRFAKENNITLYAANRMQVSSFITPYTRYGWNMKFVEDHPQFHCKTRTGTTANLCSYAYPEVQDFVIGKFADMVNLGFDGISLIFIRGIHIGFDEPVIKRFKELYPDVNPYLLPMADSRLNGVWCEFMNEFMTKLRNKVGNIPINVITGYDLEKTKHIGLDVEYWAKNGLIDSVSQVNMETFEILDDCMDDNTPEYIDLEKYKKALTERTVIKRYFKTDMEKIYKHIPEYKRLKTLYGVEVYTVIPSLRRLLPEEYPKAIEDLKKAGAEKFISWNTNHHLTDLPEWHALRCVENEPVTGPLRVFHRVLIFDGYDISQYHSNWRG